MKTILEQIGAILGMLLIFGLILYGSYYCSKKIAKMSTRESRSKYMKLEDRLMLGQDRYVAIISVGDRYFMIGSSSGDIRILTELQEEDLKESENMQQKFPGNCDFSQIMKSFGKHKDTSD